MKTGGKYLITQYCPVLPFLGVLPSPGFPRRSILCQPWPNANNKGADQPAHSHNLISTFVVRCLDIMIATLAASKISKLWLVSVAVQACLSLTCSETPKTDFLVTRLILSMMEALM